MKPTIKLVLVSTALILFIVGCAVLFVTKDTSVERTDPQSETVEVKPVELQIEQLPTVTEVNTNREQMSTAPPTNSDEQYPSGYDYQCPSGSYPIGDGECNQQPRDCQDGTQSEKCNV